MPQQRGAILQPFQGDVAAEGQILEVVAGDERLVRQSQVGRAVAKRLPDDFVEGDVGRQVAPLPWRSRLTTEPKSGRAAMPDSVGLRKPENSSTGSWKFGLKVRLRTRASLSAIVACSGISSQMSKPGTLVWIGRNSPRYSTGASGFMS